MITGLKKLQIEVSSACNLNCEHCSKKVKGERSGKIMPLITAMKAIELLPSSRPKIDFAGGEPLLNPGLIKWVLNNGPDADYFLTTNGTICSKDIARLLNKVNVSVSLDGLKHDCVRSGTFDLVCQNITDLIAGGVRVGIISTLTTKTVDGFNEEFLLLLKNMGIKNCTVNLDIVNNIQTDIEKLAERIYSLRKSGIINLGGNWIRSIKNQVMGTRSGCGVVEGKSLFVSASGNLYACSLSGEILGNVSNPPARLKPKKVDCHGCQLEQLCVGGCYFDSNKSQFCLFTKVITEKLKQDYLK